MTSRQLTLSLQPGCSVPCTLSWMVEEGFLRAGSWGEHGVTFIVGIWGPGDLVIPQLMTYDPLQLQALTSTWLQEVSPNTGQREAFLLSQNKQIFTLLKLNRTRPAETRLIQLLTWLGQRFGRVSRRGVSLYFKELNLTHRNLAEISGLTRVTVSKLISRFRQAGLLVREGEDDWLIPVALRSKQP